MGKIRTSNPQIEPKTSEIEGTNKGGTYETEEMLLTTKRKFLFSSNYITPEFLQLSFGLREDWGTEQVVFDSGSPQIDVYVYTCLLYTSEYTTTTPTGPALRGHRPRR